jgi:hypothetical protein
VSHVRDLPERLSRTCEGMRELDKRERNGIDMRELNGIGPSSERAIPVLLGLELQCSSLARRFDKILTSLHTVHLYMVTKPFRL